MTVDSDVGKVEGLERETGIEPATNGLGSRYSTIELLPLSSKIILPVNSASLECLLKVRQQVAPVLDADRDTHQSFRHTCGCELFFRKA